MSINKEIRSVINGIKENNSIDSFKSIDDENKRIVINELRKKALLTYRPYSGTPERAIIDERINSLMDNISSELRSQLIEASNINKKILHIEEKLFPKVSTLSANENLISMLQDFTKLQISHLKELNDKQISQKGHFDTKLSRSIQLDENIFTNIDGMITRTVITISEILKLIWYKKTNKEFILLNDSSNNSQQTMRSISSDQIKELIEEVYVYRKFMEYVEEWRWFEGTTFNKTNSVFKSSQNEFFVGHQICSQRIEDINENILMSSILLDKKEPDSLTISLELLKSLFGGKEILDLKLEGIQLKKWFTAYDAITRQSTIRDGVYSNNELHDVLKKCNLQEADILQIITKFTFNIRSRDLFENPIIETSTGQFYLPYFGEIGSPFKCVVSLFRGSSEWDKKGSFFENLIREIFKKYAINGRDIKLGRKFNNLECDYVFKLGDVLFLVECKNRVFFNEPYYLHAFEKTLNEAIFQLERLKNVITENPELIPHEIGKDWKSIEMMVINSFPFALGSYKGAYIADVSMIDKFFSNRVLSADILKKGAIFKSKPVINLWRGSKPTVEDLIHYLNNPPALLFYKDFVKIRCEHYKIFSADAPVWKGLDTDKQMDNFTKKYLDDSGYIKNKQE